MLKSNKIIEKLINFVKASLTEGLGLPHPHKISTNDGTPDRVTLINVKIKAKLRKKRLGARIFKITNLLT